MKNILLITMLRGISIRNTRLALFFSGRDQNRHSECISHAGMLLFKLIFKARRQAGFLFLSNVNAQTSNLPVRFKTSVPTRDSLRKELFFIGYKFFNFLLPNEKHASNIILWRISIRNTRLVFLFRS